MNFHGFIVGALLSLAALDAAARPYRIDDLDRIENVANVQLSPDGQWVLYSVDSVDVASDGRRTGLWLTRWDGGEPVRLTRATESASTPRWSPDGRWISFLRAGDGAARGSQLWLLDRTSSGEARRATDIPGGIGDYIWSPDSRRIAVLYREELPLRKDASGKEISGPWLVDRARFKEDGGVGYLHDRIKPTRIYLYDLEQKSF
ncbi:TolB family protein, partial [Steroidobacter sp.]|uniref:TolB family protein n=1 Tax=Steroidobacter sp. TaxID=1978227 RepID=UPI001A446461